MKRMVTSLAVCSAIILGQVGMSVSPVLNVQAATTNDVSVSVDLTADRTAISPYIYGVNEQTDTSTLSTTALRQGGNRYTAYNWENNFSNAGSDWLNSSDTYLTSSLSPELAKTPGAMALYLSDKATKNDIPYKMTTIQMAGYVSADGNGAVSDSEKAPSSRWKTVKATKGSEFSLVPDTTDEYVYMDEFVNYLVSNLGDSTTATGINGYNLDNEPALWSGTHSLIHPEQATCKELVDKSIEYANAIKNVDPNADVYGGALYGFNAYTGFQGAKDWDTYKNDYNWFISYYLDQMAKAEKEYGKRLVDVMDIHYYSEASGTDRVTDCKDNTHTDCIKARVQAPRTLYEKGYIENSWIGQWGQSYLPILPTIQQSIDKYYPNTKIALTEYNFGGGTHISGAIAEADALGAFGTNGVYLATLWPLSGEMPYIESAINLYTNYDGNGSKFGDTSIPTTTSNIEKSTAYASVDKSNDGKITMVVSNKDIENSQNTTITLNGDNGIDYTNATVYGITGSSSEIVKLGEVSNIENNSFTYELPPLSVVQIVIDSEEDVNYTKGDINKDGKVNIADMIKFIRHILDIETLTGDQKDYADINNDGMINIFDLLILKKMFIK